ncbi:hypothetical protein K502DRAFT_326465 [Neoconidiobolus thromboides FSU 785]|nr:hypothetical protein K502DRAFT_326465 [Neoconidiobolus thromboides FSU 785]
MNLFTSFITNTFLCAIGLIQIIKGESCLVVDDALYYMQGESLAQNNQGIQNKTVIYQLNLKDKGMKWRTVETTTLAPAMNNAVSYYLKDKKTIINFYKNKGILDTSYFNLEKKIWELKSEDSTILGSSKGSRSNELNKTSNINMKVIQSDMNANQFVYLQMYSTDDLSLIKKLNIDGITIIITDMLSGKTTKATINVPNFISPEAFMFNGKLFLMGGYDLNETKFKNNIVTEINLDTLSGTTHKLKGKIPDSEQNFKLLTADNLVYFIEKGTVDSNVVYELDLKTFTFKIKLNKFKINVDGCLAYYNNNIISLISENSSEDLHFFNTGTWMLENQFPSLKSFLKSEKTGSSGLKLNHSKMMLLYGIIVGVLFLF